MFKFVEQPENDEKVLGQKSRGKFKIMSLKVNGEMDYIPELVNWLTILLLYYIDFPCFRHHMQSLDLDAEHAVFQL